MDQQISAFVFGLMKPCKLLLISSTKHTSTSALPSHRQQLCWVFFWDFIGNLGLLSMTSGGHFYCSYTSSIISKNTQIMNEMKLQKETEKMLQENRWTWDIFRSTCGMNSTSFWFPWIKINSERSSEIFACKQQELNHFWNVYNC